MQGNARRPRRSRVRRPFGTPFHIHAINAYLAFLALLSIAYCAELVSATNPGGHDHAPTTAAR